MIGAPDLTVILHWKEDRNSWVELSWPDWVRFRGFAQGRHRMLAGAEAGEHYFLVCVHTDHGELANVIPHRYLLSENGRLVHDFDGLEPAEREEYFSIQVQGSLTSEESKRYQELGARGFAVNLPPAHTVQDRMRAVPGLVGAPSTAACWDFLSAIGICRPSKLPN